MDGLALFLYVLAYLCNLIATPIDDQLTFEARRDLTYYVLPLQSSFRYKASMAFPQKFALAVLGLSLFLCGGLRSHTALFPVYMQHNDNCLAILCTLGLLM